MSYKHQRKKEGKGTERILEEIMARDYPNFRKDKYTNTSSTNSK